MRSAWDASNVQTFTFLLPTQSEPSLPQSDFFEVLEIEIEAKQIFLRRKNSNSTKETGLASIFFVFVFSNGWFCVPMVLDKLIRAGTSFGLWIKLGPCCEVKYICGSFSCIFHSRFKNVLFAINCF